MNFTKSAAILASVFSIAALLSGNLAHADLIYTVSPLSGYSGTGWELTGGTITTNGTLGIIDENDIVSWNFSYTANGQSRILSGASDAIELQDNEATSFITASNSQIILTSASGTSSGDAIFFRDSTDVNSYVAFRGSSTDDRGLSILSDQVEGIQFATSNPAGTSGYQIAATSIPEPSSAIFFIVAGSFAVIRSRRHCQASHYNL